MTKKLIILILLCLPAIWPLLQPGFFPSHDGEWMVIRLSAFHQSLADGQFPVRWSARLNHGYGYPVLNFLYPLPFYLGEIAYLISHQFTTAINWVFIFGTLGSVLTMFIWLKQRFAFFPSLAATLLYIYTPYRFVDIYVRGSVGESLGFAFIPLIFLSLDFLPKRPRLGILLGSLSVAATILSHNVFVIFVLLAAIYAWFTLPKPNLGFTVVMFCLGAALSAYFWLPALAELKYVQAGNLIVANPQDHLVTLADLISPRWAYGPSVPGRPDSMSFQLGLVNILVVIAAAFIIRRQKLWLTIFVASVLLMHRLTNWIWPLLPAISVIQFPWRLLSVTTFVSAVLSAHLTQSKRWLAPIIIIAAVLLNLTHASPQATTLAPDAYYATNDDSTTVRNEYNTIWVKQPFTERDSGRVKFTAGRGVIVNFSESNLGMSFRVEASEDATLELSTMYYPGWIAVRNGRPTPIDYASNGLIRINVDKGISQVSTYFKDTRLRQVANYLSLITLLGLFSHVFYTLVLKEAPPTPAKLRAKSR